MRVSFDVELSALELETLWTHLGLGPRPMELVVPSPRCSADEAEADRIRAWESLARKGKAEAGELDVEIQDLLTLLAHAERCLALHYAIRTDEIVSPEIMAVASANSDIGILAVREGNAFRFGWLRSISLTEAIADLLPEPPNGEVGSATVAVDVLAQAVEQAGDCAEAFKKILVGNGIHPDNADLLWAIGSADRTLYATFGAAVRDANGQMQSVHRQLEVFDTPYGRCASSVQSGWVNFSGITHTVLLRQLDSLMNEVLTPS